MPEESSKAIGRKDAIHLFGIALALAVPAVWFTTDVIPHSPAGAVAGVATVALVMFGSTRLAGRGSNV